MSTSSFELEATPLKGRRVLVVGASTGIGRVVAHTLCAEGAQVAFAARRLELCEQEASEAAGTAVGLRCDVSDPEQCDGVVAEAVERLGGLDDVVYAAGLIAIVALADADAGWWRRTFETNVMGASLVTRAALPHLRANGGTIVFLSSVSAEFSPWPGIGVYTATKAALNRLIDNWRAEHPEVGFARVGVGPTAGGANTAQVHEGAFPHQARWADMQLVSGASSPPASIARQVVTILTDPSRIWDVTVQPRDPALPWSRG